MHSVEPCPVELNPCGNKQCIVSSDPNDFALITPAKEAQAPMSLPDSKGMW